MVEVVRTCQEKTKVSTGLESRSYGSGRLEEKGTRLGGLVVDFELALLVSLVFLALEFRDTLIQHMEAVKNRLLKRHNIKWLMKARVNENKSKTTEEKTDTSNALGCIGS
ncbi:hypothetical protein Tco_0878139 [Tanacetum coccineum]|uniref:Uncharacterized protein n=1 Tax=Tanacetum coccineum TaxID=301880 RepID=A0ABQ5BYN4_9ASTR